MASVTVSEAISEQVVALPAPALRRFIGSYVGYRLIGYPPGIHVGLPSRSLTIVIALGVPLEMSGLPDLPDTAVHTLVGGLHAGPVYIHHDGFQHGVQLDVTPLGARALLGVRSAEVASSVVSLDQVIGSAADELFDRLSCSTTWTAAFAVLDDVLTRRIARHATVRPELSHAWDLLTRTDGSIEVGAVAQEVGWTRRHLGDRFRREFGLTPKVASRVMRFERAKNLITGGADSFAAVAASAGYSDQAHMVREWRAMTGFSPSGWMRNEQFPIVQDAAVVGEG